MQVERGVVQGCHESYSEGVVDVCPAVSTMIYLDHMMFHIPGVEAQDVADIANMILASNFIRRATICKGRHQ